MAPLGTRTSGSVTGAARTERKEGAVVVRRRVVRRRVRVVRMLFVCLFCLNLSEVGWVGAGWAGMSLCDVRRCLPMFGFW